MQKAPGDTDSSDNLSGKERHKTLFNSVPNLAGHGTQPILWKFQEHCLEIAHMNN
jgi:hypothetical protein